MSSTNLESSFVLIDNDNNSRGPRTNSSSQAASSSDKATTSYPGVSYAHDWSAHATGGIRICGRHFVDRLGRVCGLRGVNLSGSCKTPCNDDYSVFPDGHEHVTFVGRPFPLEDAPEHLARLRRWGLTFIRLLVTWEALEHEGPGKYDTDYLQYLQQLLSLFPQYGIVAFVSMHQDVWSRYTGGSGAPAWTVTAVGFDLHALEETGAAWLRGVRGGGHVPSERGIWPCGYQKLAASTMATCFWAGDAYTPKLKIEGVSVQEYLQTAFLKAWEVLVRSVGHLDAVIGFEMMNEPHRGYIELPSMHEFNYNTDLHLAHIPSALQSFALGAGHPLAVPHWTRSFPMPTRMTSHKLVNEAGVSVWREDGPTGGKCVWEMHGVWGWDKRKKEAVALRESYFVKHPMTGKKIDWYTDFYYPFLMRWADSVKSLVGTEKFVFTEAIPNEFCPSSWTADRRPANMVYAPHWYDLDALFRKAFGNFTVNVQDISRGVFPLKTFHWGQKSARENYSKQIRRIVEEAHSSLGETPVIIGECGVPMDMNRGEAFASDDWTWQARMMDCLITALEKSLIGFTLWNYNAYNDDTAGDRWNGENFSWFSQSRVTSKSTDLDQSSTSLDEGGRLLRAVVRPYPAKTAGLPLSFDYEMNTGRVTFEWAIPEASAGSEGTSEEVSSPSTVPPLRVPKLHLKSNVTQIFFPLFLVHGREIVVSGLQDFDNYSYDRSRQTFSVICHDNRPGTQHRVVVSLDPPLTSMFVLNDFWGDFRLRIWSAMAIFVGIVAFLLMR